MILDTIQKLFFKKVTKAEQRLILLDGDQGSPVVLAYNKMFPGEHAEFVVAGTTPNNVVKNKNITVCSVQEVARRGKETADKFIAIRLQKAISEGCRNFVVISSDYDFVDIFKMCIMVNPDIEMKFEIVVPNAKGILARTTSQSSITITKI